MCRPPVFKGFRQIAKNDYLLRRVGPPVHPSAWNNSTYTERIFKKFDIWLFFEKLSRKFQVSLKSDKNNGYFPCMFMVISRSVHLRMRNVWDKSCRENQNTHFMFNNFPLSPLPPPENHAIQKIMSGACECGNESTGFIKCGEFLTSWGTVSFSRGTLPHRVS